jgi:Arc/MetJ-type ribon-helix-helix transcriptional regulator
MQPGRGASYATVERHTIRRCLPVGDGNTLAGAERIERVTVRVGDDLLDEFDAEIEESERWGSRSEAMRELMRSVVDGDVQTDGGREPPAEDDLADAYRVVRDLSRGRGWVPEPVVLSELAQQQGIDKSSARRRLVQPLVDRGYAARQTDVSGYTAVRAHE